MIGGATTFLDNNNCQLVKRAKYPDAVHLTMKRTSDDEEGHAFLRVNDAMKKKEQDLLAWAEKTNAIDGLTLNEISEIDVPINLD